jgi:GLPGLI family protein
MYHLKFINFVFCFLCFHLLSFSQKKDEYANAKVSYGVKMYIDREKGFNKWLEENRPGLNDIKENVASELDFSLLLNDTTSLFYLEKKLYSDNYAASNVMVSIKYFGRIKQKPENYITEELEEAFGKFLVSRPYQTWELHDETKTIGEYLCFKATTFYTITTPQGKVFKHSFTAWYSPELPYKYGPAGYGNLPGLIIELQGKEFTYGVKKIEFYNDEKNKENELPKLKNKKQITEEEFEKLAAKDEDRWRKKRNKN